MGSIKRTFKVWVDEADEWYEDGEATFPRRSGLDLEIRNLSLYCPYCDNIWARIRWDLGPKETSLSHVACKGHGLGLVLPLFMRQATSLEFPLEILKRDFLILMEKK